MKLMLDLFSGLGGASQAFMDSPEWAVLRYDNDPTLSNVAATTICDLTQYKIECRHKIELIWASPPCDEFSMGFHAPKPTAQRRGETYQPNLTLAKRGIEIIEELKPEFWVLENVVGSIKDLEPLLGEPRQIIGPFVLWGNFPLIHTPRDYLPTKKTDLWPSENRKQLRSKVPYAISEGLFHAIRTQKTLENY